MTLIDLQKVFDAIDHDILLPKLYLKGFDQSLMTGMISTDVQKAFDTIDHDILLPKLYAIGFCKNSVNWF